ncbi:nagb/rpia/CoA transferase-like protein [Coccomyxa subellipsoidea C-169]|uniref:Nagb/rpia/CoA transferase-like protein n=1 Tax=Coccomyxa subellipsoidea (strain C-169) TaxID=574566 RepID=I0YQZ4_COCSC|nr:nagb/rpia/CoA transferase-like protein [Coccomyxa subellipsoidea C-169]EIE20813.1 nagb/rpia/CoA transferase-like protein [Coccomyxa subellipsoidea C-169]|eukprot:XP_005645357.1 nagb/rpia/CoA transferase-like protein [Coccomyxa subellipsoidea C-169]
MSRAVAHLLRDVAARRPGPITKIGLGTFVDPREQGGKINSPSQADAVEVVTLGGQEYLWYKAPAKIDVALLRGTNADLDGNITFERESLLTDALNQAMAAHNSGGIVIVQVERLVAPGSLNSRLVHLPGAIVDKIVVAPAELHRQTITMAGHDASLTGEIRAPASHIQAMRLDERRIIAHRAMLEISRPNTIVNLGIGMPEARHASPEQLLAKPKGQSDGVARMVATHGSAQIPNALPAHLTTEAGMFGGFPAGAARFGAAHNADCIVPCATMLDFYNGGGVDMACLGAAEVDQEGNVNVHSFPGRQPGCGGFIDISQAAKEVIFAGTFTTGGLKVTVENGKLRIIQEGRSRKFKRRVAEKTFAASSAKGRRILYVTERAVFRLREGEGIELTEIAPGVDLERDVLAFMPFRPLMKDVKIMDKRCFMP